MIALQPFKELWEDSSRTPEEKLEGAKKLILNTNAIAKDYEIDKIQLRTNIEYWENKRDPDLQEKAVELCNTANRLVNLYNELAKFCGEQIKFWEGLRKSPPPVLQLLHRPWQRSHHHRHHEVYNPGTTQEDVLEVPYHGTRSNHTVHRGFQR